MPERLAHRIDIDGLRAIAIVPVVLYHAGFSAPKGGFVGVDVFFVISGYLMASLILGEMKQGAFGLARFYERRIRRIFPALFAVITASAAAAWFLFMPIELEYFGRSVMGAALFASNITFWKESSYFDTAAQVKPLLHTWSLAVEEQFYILFPLLLVLLDRLSRRRLITVALSLLLLGSFAYSAWEVERSPVSAFYLAPSRFWELLLGAMLAIGVAPNPRSVMRSQGLALLGVALIGWAVFGYSETTPFPGVNALVPCLGAALVIHARAEGGPVGLVLGSPPLVFIGLISYSLYLWHWPLIVFTRYAFGDELSPLRAAWLLVVSTSLAALSWRFIEQPFRGRKSRIDRKILFAGAAAAVVAALIFGGLVDREEGVPSRLPVAIQAIYKVSYDTGRFLGPACFIDSEGEGPTSRDIGAGTLCSLGNSDDPEIRFLIWGDSHAGAMAPAIDLAARQAGIHGLFVGQASCPPLLDFDPGQTSRPKVQRCKETNAAVVGLIAERRISTVFLIARWPKYVHGTEYGNEGYFFDPSRLIPLEDKSAPVAHGLDQTLSALSEVGTRMVLVMDVPEIGYNVPHALAKAAMSGRSVDIAPSPAAVRMRQALARSTLQTYAAKYDAAIIDPTPAICDQTRCSIERDGVILYRDEDHLSRAGAESISDLYRPLLDALR
ncbi:MAG TPA: acyltransferase family protein [Myxococcota bacterium]|nr:acyltransferase family protein [Myxococcota bacterium]